MKRLLKTLLFLLTFCSVCAAQQVIDKMVATVNGGVRTELITYSDLMWQLALQPDTPLDNPRSDQLNSALHLLIDQRLILQEAAKLPTIVPTTSPPTSTAARRPLGAPGPGDSSAPRATR